MKDVLISFLFLLAVQNERAPRHGSKRVIPTRVQSWTPPPIVGYVPAESPQVTMPFGFRNLSIHK
jgi:hypothetical protein